MDEEQNNGQSTGEKISNDIQDTVNLVKDGSKLAKDVGTGNVLGIAKDAFSILKNKKFWILIAINLSIPIIIIISLASFIRSAYHTVADKVQDTISKISDFVDWEEWKKNETRGIIKIKDKEIDKLIDGMKELNIDLDELNLMGDTDYSNSENEEEIEKENREALRKYVRKFYEAQAVTQTFYPNPGFLDKVWDRLTNLRKGVLYGSVYVHRTQEEEVIDPKSRDKGTLLEYIEYDKLKKRAENNNINQVEKYYSIDEEEDKLVIPVWTTVNKNGKETTKVSLRKYNYRNNLSQYTTAMNFFFYLSVITRNAEFVSAVADLAKTGEIHIYALETKNVRTEVEVLSKYENRIKSPRIVTGPDNEYLYTIPAQGPIKSNKPITEKSTTITTGVSIQLKITYVKTWFCEQTITYVKENTSSGPDVTTLTGEDDENLKDDAPLPVPGYNQPDAIWYTNKTKTITITNQGYKYKESTRTDVKDRTGEKGDQGILDINNNNKVDDEESVEKGDAEEKEWIDENTTFLGLLDNYFRIPRTDRYEAAGKINFVNGAEWLFELMDKDSTLQNLQQLMRFIMHKYTGDDYGANDFDFQVYDAKDFISISGSKLLKEYIRYWEGSGEISADGTKYIVYKDSGGVLTVGYGVALKDDTLTEFINNGYSIEEGAEIDIEFVDMMEDKIRNSKKDEVEAYVNGLDLKEYQINALVSRAYNCGAYGAIGTLRGNPRMNFVDSYNTYFDPKEDDYFEKHLATANFNHKLYTQYMNQPVTDIAQNYLEGLVIRRKSEWNLFQTGYYDVLGLWHSNGGDLVAACEELTQELIARGARYGDQTYGDIVKCYEQDTMVVCASYVAIALYKAELLTPEQINAYRYHWTGSGGIPDMLAAAGWTQVPLSEIQPGDIVNHHEVHVMVYAGDGQCWDQSSAVFSTTGQAPTGTTVTYDLSPYTVWRAP